MDLNNKIDILKRKERKNKGSREKGRKEVGRGKTRRREGEEEKRRQDGERRARQAGCCASCGRSRETRCPGTSLVGGVAAEGVGLRHFKGSACRPRCWSILEGDGRQTKDVFLA